MMTMRRMLLADLGSTPVANSRASGGVHTLPRHASHQRRVEAHIILTSRTQQLIRFSV
jgi:hypothetical protein